MFGDCPIEAPLVTSGNQLRCAAAHVPECQDSRYRLGKDRGGCTAQNAVTQNAQKDQIQHGIENGGESQKFQWCFCIADTFKPCGQGIVAEGKGSPQKGDPQISHGDGMNLNRNLQAVQNPGSQRHAQSGDDAADDHAGKHRVCQHPAEFLPVFCAEGLTHQHTCTDAHTADGQNHQIHHRSGNSFRSQGFLADEPSGNDGIYCVIAQLHPVAQQQRQSMLP